MCMLLVFMAYSRISETVYFYDFSVLLQKSDLSWNMAVQQQKTEKRLHDGY